MRQSLNVAVEAARFVTRPTPAFAGVADGKQGADAGFGEAQRRDGPVAVIANQGPGSMS